MRQANHRYEGDASGLCVHCRHTQREHVGHAPLTARLLVDLTAEGVRVPAGTLCEVEGDLSGSTVDLIARVGHQEVIFWAKRGEVEALDWGTAIDTWRAGKLEVWLAEVERLVQSRRLTPAFRLDREAAVRLYHSGWTPDTAADRLLGRSLGGYWKGGV